MVAHVGWLPSDLPGKSRCGLYRKPTRGAHLFDGRGAACFDKSILAYSPFMRAELKYRVAMGGTSLHLVGVCGSLRAASLNRALLRALGDALPPGVTLAIDDALGQFPLFSSDIQPEPRVVADAKARLAAADGVVFACPEYNYSVTGALKNALDWYSAPPASSPLRRKPCAMIGGASGMSGSMRAQLHLRQILLYSDAQVLAQPEVLVARQHERFDANGVLTDEPTRKFLQSFAAAFVAHIEKHRR